MDYDFIFENYENLFKENNENDEKSIINNNLCQNCNNDLLNNNGIFTCSYCGCLNYSIIDYENKAKKLFYKRKNYIKNILKEIN